MLVFRLRSLRRGDLRHDIMYESFSFFVMVYDTGIEQKELLSGCWAMVAFVCTYCVIRCVLVQSSFVFEKSHCSSRCFIAAYVSVSMVLHYCLVRTSRSSHVSLCVVWSGAQFGIWWKGPGGMNTLERIETAWRAQG